MSGNIVNNPGRERLNQLMKAARARPGRDEAPPEAPQYNWHEPHYFSRAQFLKLNDFVKRAMAALAEKFSGFCSSEFEVAADSVTQHFASEFATPASGGAASDYRLPFGPDPEHPCGLIGLPDETALIWARQLLGDAESDKGSGKTLSQLEESLLLDLASALVEGFSHSGAGAGLHLAGSIVRGLWPLPAAGTEELSKISISVKRTGSQDASKAYFLITCEMLKSVIGLGAKTSAQFSANDVSRAILSHLQTMPVTVTAQLASTTLTFGEVMNLQVDDILLLDKKVDEPAELIIDDRTVYCGWPAKSAGKYALTIAPGTADERT
jgi:flagellar motor switch protein FliM